ncbi:MAG: TPM domain-containing protein [Pseudomonadota bacterium]
MKAKRRWCPAALLALLLLFNMGMKVEDVPNPRSSSGGFVQDSALLLSAEAKGSIEEICAGLERDSGAEMAVVAVDSLEGQVIEDYAEKLFKQFGIGKRGLNNGILILVSRDDRKVRIEVGYGLEGALPDAKTGRLIDDYALPRFRDKDFGGGLISLAEAVAAVVKNEPMPQQQVKETDRFAPLRYFLYAICALTLAAYGGLISIVIRKRSRAEKTDILKNRYVFPIILLILGGVAAFFVAYLTDSVTASFGYFFVAVAATFVIEFLVRAVLLFHTSRYRLACPSCRHAMDLGSQDDEAHILSTREQAEERAENVAHELWTCPGCGHKEHTIVKLTDQKPCPKCSWNSIMRQKKRCRG